MNHGVLLISLDFEMTWGGVGVWDTNGYKESHVSNVRDVVARLLDLFKKYEVKATFATVGLLMLKDKYDAKDNIPESKPSYNNSNLSPFENNYLDNIIDESLYFAPDIIDQLQSYDNIEIGTHTYSHYYCWEQGQTIEQFEADIKKATEVAYKKGLELKSIVFPRNQVSADYLQVCNKYGVISYRGNAEKFYGKTSNGAKAMVNKVGRFVDSYIGLGNKTSYSISDINSNETPINLKASRFLRPYSNRFALLDKLKIRRICHEMQYAAKHGKIYHLWWHPHNFGTYTSQNLKELEVILKCFKSCQQNYGMESVTMKELYYKIISQK